MCHRSISHFCATIKLKFWKGLARKLLGPGVTSHLSLIMCSVKQKVEIVVQFCEEIVAVWNQCWCLMGHRVALVGTLAMEALANGSPRHWAMQAHVAKICASSLVVGTT